MTDPYKVLGIAPGAGADEIKSAYRMLARKWHPDRFPEGPERMWAEERMIKLNRAYEEAIKRCASFAPHAEQSASDESKRAAQDELLSDVRSLMALGQLDHARRTLLRADGRGAEWNYLFGAILMRLGDYDKAAVYFGISSRMRPDCAQYRAALRSAEALRDRGRKPAWQHGVSQFMNSLRNKRPAARTYAAK
jgi:molecular chaperone DnaJ